ncbi:MAG: hypothetical protein V4534_01245 [Myxococcota bacterium]
MRILALFVVAVLGFGLWGMGFSANPTRAMYGYLFAYVSALTIPLGCIFYVLIQHLTRAGWSVLTRRMAEFGMAVVPMFAVLFLPIALLGHDLFPWSHAEHLDEILIKKTPYLNMPFFMVRAVVYFVIWSAVAIWFYRKSVAQDAGGRAELSRTMGKVSTAAVILIALSTSFASFDWLMSLQPHWYSTVFGVYFFAGCFLSALVFIAMMLMRSTVPVTAEHYQDIGKLLFGFTVFWAYIGFSQFMLYWYANIPEETEFYMHRLHHGWEYISYWLIVTNFFLPFFLIMSRHMKRYKPVFTIGCTWILLAHFLDIYWLVMPNAGDHHWWLSLPNDIGALVGMLALFLMAVAILKRNKSAFPKGDPRLSESLAFENY